MGSAGTLHPSQPRSLLGAHQQGAACGRDPRLRPRHRLGCARPNPPSFIMYRAWALSLGRCPGALTIVTPGAQGSLSEPSLLLPGATPEPCSDQGWMQAGGGALRGRGDLAWKVRVPWPRASGQQGRRGGSPTASHCLAALVSNPCGSCLGPTSGFRMCWDRTRGVAWGPCSWPLSSLPCGDPALSAAVLWGCARARERRGQAPCQTDLGSGRGTAAE